MEQGEFEKLAAAILALFPPLPEAEQRVALTLYRLLADEGAVTPHRLARTEMLPEMQRGADGAVIGYGGLTITPSAHRMQFARSTRYAWCAWDTLFIPELLGEPARVESTCPATGERIALTVRPDGVHADDHVPFVSFVVPQPAAAAADIVGHFCCHVHFFASEAAGREWISRRPATFLATLEQAWQLGRRRNARRYPMVHA